jgi:diacylglycerol kinase family enzyme
MGDDEQALEAAGVTPAGARDALRLGLNAALGDWRQDASVEVRRCREARIWSARRIPAILDGETVRLDALAQVRFRSAVVRLLAPPKEAD